MSRRSGRWLVASSSTTCRLVTRNNLPPRSKKNPVALDIAAVEIDRTALPATSFFSAFTPDHLITEFDRIEVGTPVLIVGFPLGFHDHVHHLPVARQAMVASAFGIRFQGLGYF
jgi:hypothetical protein